MTVLVLDSPELIARAVLLEAAEPQEVQAEETRVVHADTEVSLTADQPARASVMLHPNRRRRPGPCYNHPPGLPGDVPDRLAYAFLPLSFFHPVR